VVGSSVRDSRVSTDDNRLPLSQDEEARLARNLKRSEIGVKTDIRTPFYAKVDRSEIIDRFKSELGFTEFDELTDIDEKEISKIGPYSIMLPWKDRRDSLDAFRKQVYTGSDSALGTVLQDMAKLFPQSSFRPMGLDTAFDSMPHGTMLGLPTMSSDESYKGEYLQRAKRLVSADEIYPCVAGWRGQPKGLHEIPKQRLVWMFDHVETILGLSILYPVLNRLRVLPGFSAWSSDLVVDDAVTDLLQNARGSGNTIVSADYSNFDASVSSVLLECAFDLLRYWFTDETKSRLDVLQEVFSTVPLITPDGVFKDRNGGVPSGSALTNLIDTLVNLIAGKYVSVRLGCKLTDFEVLGDDSIFVFSPTPGVEEISEVLKELGLDSNPEKQFVSAVSAHFLQRWHSLDYQIDGKSRGVRSPYRALSGMLSLERWMNNDNHRFKYLMSTRLIMQAENTRWDPRFHKFVELIKEGDEILQSGIDPAVIFKRAGGSDEIRSGLSIASYPFNVQNPDNVEEFATSRVLREIT
jgi:hypothetical protein